MFFPVWAFSQAGSVEWFWRCPNFNILSAPTLFAHTATGHGDCRFRPDPANPVSVSKHSTVRSRKPPPENPYTPTTCTEEPTSPLRPTHTTGRAEGAFFVSDFSRASKWTRDGFALERVKLRPKRVVRLLAFALSHIVDGRPRLMSYRASRARVCMRPMQIGEKEKAFFSERPTFCRFVGAGR